MEDIVLTVFTPAYNRAHTIVRTYQSLCRQTCKKFEWLIIDDGSTDNTHELVESWILENNIPIRYIYQENQGMHGAHNTAYKNIKTELNVCIDSDDFMPENAVEVIIRTWKERGSEEFAGIIGLDISTNGNVIGSVFPKGLETTTLTDYYAHGGTGDKKLVYRTSVVNSYPEYPIFDNEKYVGLNYKYMLIDQNYKLIVVNNPLVVVDYQTTGSSFNMYKQYWNNPKGFAFLRKVEMQLTKSLKRRFICCIHYVSSAIISKNSGFLKESPYKLLTILACPFGVVLYFFIRYKVRNNILYKIN